MLVGVHAKVVKVEPAERLMEHVATKLAKPEGAIEDQTCRVFVHSSIHMCVLNLSFKLIAAHLVARAASEPKSFRMYMLAETPKEN